MTRHIQRDDVLCLKVPDDVDPLDTVAMAPMLAKAARESVRAQWSEHSPVRIIFDVQQWLITSDPDQVDTFQPAHDCEQCRLGNVRAKAFLVENPGKHIAMANIHYTEHLPDHDIPMIFHPVAVQWITSRLDNDARVTVELAIETLADVIHRSERAQEHAKTQVFQQSKAGTH